MNAKELTLNRRLKNESPSRSIREDVPLFLRESAKEKADAQDKPDANRE